MSIIKVSDLTTVSLSGTGVFDKLMQTTHLYLSDEYKKGRIKGSDYSKVYLGAIDATMQQSLAFILGKQQSDKQADLLSAQILQVNAETAITSKKGLLLDAQLAESTANTVILTKKAIQLDTEILITAQKLIQTTSEAINSSKLGVKLDAETSNILKDTAFKTQGILKLVQDTLLTTEQTAKVTADKAISDKQLFKMTEEILLTTAQTAKVNQDTTNLGILATKLSSEKALLDKQNLKLDKDILQIVANTAKVNKDITKMTSEIANISQDTLNKIATNAIAVEAKLKTTAETSLLKQKTDTEKAQILDIVNLNAVAGAVGRRNAVLSKQIEGYQRDTEQKMAKMAYDVYAVTLSSGVAATTPLAINQITQVMTDAITKAGITVPPPAVIIP